MKRICVFCGSKVGLDDRHGQAAAALGLELAARGMGLVFGGGSVGLMGLVADAVLEQGGEVIGVIPENLATEELLHPRVPDMRRVGDMHTRKALMAELSDAFVALPGGYGTLEELMEMITWAQLGIHRKPIGLLNSVGYFDPLVAFIEHSIQSGFIKSRHRNLFVVEQDPVLLIDRLAAHELPNVTRWEERKKKMTNDEIPNDERNPMSE